MHIEAQWTEHAHPTLYLHYDSPLTNVDTQALPYLLNNAADEAGGHLNVIMDFSHAMPLPEMLVMTLQNALEATASHLGVVVIIGATPTLEALMNTLNHIFHTLGDALQFVDTLAEANNLVTHFFPTTNAAIH